MDMVRLVVDEIAETIEGLRSFVSSPSFALVELRYLHGHVQLVVVLAGAQFPSQEIARDSALAAVRSDEWPDTWSGRLAEAVEDRVARAIGADEQVRVFEVARSVAAELGRRRWADVAPGFEVVLATSRVDDLGGPLAPMRDALGPHAVDGFLARFGSPLASRALRVADRPAIERLAVERGIAGPRARQMAHDARWALMLEPDDGKVSRLGGRPVLPVGTSWPSCAGRPMTHLATIDSSELPIFEDRELLPAAGFLAFFADLSEDAELWEPTQEHEEGTVRIVTSGPDETVSEPEPPAGIEMPFRERRVAARPQLQIRAPQTRGAQAEVELAAELSGGPAVHQLLGHPSVVQEDPRGADDIALLHLSWDEPLGFTYLDGGDLLIFGSHEDIRARRWSRMTWLASSA